MYPFSHCLATTCLIDRLMLPCRVDLDLCVVHASFQCFREIKFRW